MGQDGIDLGEKLAILGLALLFWVIWVAFADASLSTARAQFRRHPPACTLALLVFAYMVALRLFLTVAEAAGKIAGSRKKGHAEGPRQPTGEKNADA